MSPDSTSWNARYLETNTPWDLGKATPAFEALLASDLAPMPGKLLVPGCGRGHDAILFAEHGFEVIGIDFAPAAIDFARELARKRGVAARFEVADLFDLPSGDLEAFDLVLEYTCFCAIEPDRRDDYARVVSELLVEGGVLLGLFFPTGPFGSGEGPPHRVTRDDVEQHFGERFAIERLEPPAVSDPGREGLELLGRLKKR
ncbi:MAG: methyltransferase domain-containing protein [Planctomycetota bacterium]